MFNCFKKNKLINKQSLIFLVFLLLFSVVFLITEKYSQSFHFVDEEDHLVFGYYMNRSYQLYRDLSSNHQPLVYFLSNWTQKITRPTTIFLLIKRGREAIFLYSFILSLFLLFQFWLPFLIFGFFFELTKFFIFGNLLLAESLVVYPLIFIIGETFRIIFYNHKPKKWQSFVFGLANFLIIFNLLPLIPSLLLFDLIYLIKTKRIKHFFIGIILPTIVLFIFISPFDWFRETVFYNLKYVVPTLSPIKHKLDFLKFFIFPFSSLFKRGMPIFNQFIQLFSLLSIVNFVFLLFSKNNKKIFYWLIFIFSILAFNNRVLNLKETYYYRGFHLLPWYAGFVFFNLLTVELIGREIKGFKIFPMLLVLIGGGALFLNSQMPYFVKINKDYEHNVNFFPYFLIGKAINVVSQPKDRLAVLPDESLIYWQSGLKPTTRQIVYYEWEYWVPELRQQMDEVFTNSPPEFIYADFKRIGFLTTYLPILNSALEKNYWQVTSQGIAQNLFIKKQKIREVNDKQWEEWQKLSFDKIEL